MPDPLLDDFLDALAPAKKKRRPGGRVSVTCWAHDDHDPSASVWIDDKGKVAFECFVCHDHEHLVNHLPAAALRVAQQSWGVQTIELRLPRHKPTPPTAPTNGAAAEYVYTDEHGTPLFVKKRFERDGKKTFVIQQPDGRRGRGDADPVLYRLPDVKAAVAAGDPIFIPEGEKDADRLAALGLTATTNPDGAGTWRPDIHNPPLAGAHIVIIPDLDDAGFAHAADITTHLLDVAADIREIVLPVPEKGDVSDWLDQGHTVEELLELVDQTEPSHKQRPAYLADWQNIWNLEVGGFLLPPMFLEGRGHSLYAGAKTGKSLFLLWLIVRELERNPELVVIYLDYEMGAPDLVERLEKMGIFGYRPWMDRFYYAMFPPMAPLDTEAGSQDLLNLVDFATADHPNCKPFVVIDTISRAVEGEENSSDTYRAFYRHTGMALKAEGITWCRVDHTGKDKGQGQRGSSAKNDDVDVVWEMTRKDDGGAILKPTLQRVGNLDTFKVGYEENPMAFTLSDADLITVEEHALASRAWAVGTRPYMTHEEAWIAHQRDYPKSHKQRMTQEEMRAALRVMHRDKQRDYSNPPHTHNAEQGELHR